VAVLHAAGAHLWTHFVAQRKWRQSTLLLASADACSYECICFASCGNYQAAHLDGCIHAKAPGNLVVSLLGTYI
jgi:hypothetical protein